MIIRAAGPGDLPGILALHLESWRGNYRGLFPDSFLGDVAERELTALWRPERLQSFVVKVALSDEGLSGFAACDPAHPAGPFLDNIHVRSGARKRGIGRALMAAMAAELQAAGHATLWCLVLDGNAAARAAYARLGGREGPAQSFEVLGEPVLERPVRWSDLGALARAHENRVPGDDPA